MAYTPGQPMFNKPDQSAASQKITNRIELAERMKALGVNDDIIDRMLNPDKPMPNRYQVGRIEKTAKEDPLSPKNLAATQQFLLPFLGAQYSPQIQQGMHGARQRAASSGLLGTPFGLSAEAGLRGSASTGLVNEAMQRAIQMGQQKANIKSGGAAIMAGTPPTSGLELLGIGRDAFGTASLFRALNGSQRANQSMPYQWPTQGMNTAGSFQIPNAQQFMPQTRYP